jgi:type II restriction enzyme
MKFISEFWNKLNINNQEEALGYFKSTVLQTNKNKSYYNNWKGISSRVDTIKEEVINALNSTLFPLNKDAFKQRVKENKEILPVIKMILLSNEKKIHMVDEGKDYIFDFFNKKAITETEYQTLFDILELTDFYYPFENNLARDVKSYLKLVLVGMDTNGRKNRSGTNYETNTRLLLDSFCESHGFTGISGANNKKVEETFGSEILKKIQETGKDIPDYVFYTGKTVFLIETNYSDGGSKLQATIESYIELSDKIKTVQDVKFIYLTDGKQWVVKKSTHLSDGWNNIDYIVNTNMVKDGVLEYILKEEEK